MRAIRHLLAQRHWAVLICAATLLLKLLVPTGYMIGSEGGRIAITICSGFEPRTMTTAMPGATAMSGMHGGSSDHGTSKDHGKAEMPCAFSGLSAAALGATDPLQLAALIAFVMAMGFATTVLPSPVGPAHLRPPLRGPPAYL